MDVKKDSMVTVAVINFDGKQIKSAVIDSRPTIIVEKSQIMSHELLDSGTNFFIPGPLISPVLSPSFSTPKRLPSCYFPIGLSVG